MDLLETLGGKDWLKLVIGASRVRVWRTSSTTSSETTLKTEGLSFMYKGGGVDYKVTIEKSSLLRGGEEVPGMVDGDRSVPRSLRNVYSRVVLGNTNINFKEFLRRYSMDCDETSIRGVVERLTGLSLSPF
jgi:hypothetical protein